MISLYLSMLLSVLELESPDYLIVCFDKGPSFRVDVYAGYKAHREKMPDEMRGQMIRIREIVTAFAAVLTASSVRAPVAALS